MLDNAIPRLIVGFVVVMLVSFLFEGGAQFVLVSIICTAGISLVVWLPVSYLIGTTVEYLFKKVKNSGKGGEQASFKYLMSNQTAASAPTLTNDQLALINYIKQAKDGGLTDSDIAKNLKQSGWQGGEIKDAYKLTR